MTGFVVNHNRVNNDFDRMLKNIISSPVFPFSRNEEYVPAVDIVENEHHLNLFVELPGMEKGDIKVVIKDDILTVSGERKSGIGNQDNSIIRSEIYSGSFSRSFTLPDNVEPDNIKADYKNGILKIVLNKKEETRPKEINVNVQ